MTRVADFGQFSISVNRLLTTPEHDGLGLDEEDAGRVVSTGDCPPSHPEGVLNRPLVTVEVARGYDA